MKIEGKTVCVTGGSGFIGSHLCRALLSRGAKVIALDDFSVGQRERLADIADDIEIVMVDIRDKENLKEPIQKSQIVYALAAIANPRTCQQDFSHTFDVNILGTANILSLCADTERVVFPSSIMVYGDPKYLPIDDRHPIEARDPYSVSKIMCEHLLKVYNYLYNIPFTIVRNSNTFGPGQDPDYLIPTLILEGLTKKQIEIWDPRIIRDFLYIDNCVDALLKIVESESAIGETMNLGSGQGIATGELADIICKHLDTTWIDARKPSPVSSKLISDINKTKALTGWEPKISLEEGLRRTIEYYQLAVQTDASGKEAG
ncbi:NAD-dependent epimerase/dehydratase family protein [Chloroflexota bacterium]